MKHYDESQEASLRTQVKKELRKRMRALRAALPHDAASERSARIVAALEALPAWRAARSVALFWPMEGRREIDLRALAVAARLQGKRVSYPRIVLERDLIELAEVDDDAALEEGPVGAREPAATAPVCARGEVDVVVVPALAIDLEGRRIGYGRGFYDRLLPAYAPPALTVGVAFELQLLGEIPETEGDVRVQHVVTDARSFAAGSLSTLDVPAISPHSAAIDGVRTIARPR